MLTQYDRLGRVVRTQQPGGNITNYQYAQTGQVVTANNPGHNTATLFTTNMAVENYVPQGNIIDNANNNESSPPDDSSIDLSASLG